MRTTIWILAAMLLILPAAGGCARKSTKKVEIDTSEKKVKIEVERTEKK